MTEPLTQEMQAEITAVLRRMVERTARGECFQCGTRLTAKRQSGSCVYAEPCGCRLGQGRLTDPQGRRVKRVECGGQA